MTLPPGAALPSTEDLLSIIRIQTEIARLGLDLNAVMGLAATACMELTAADGAAVEIVEGPLMVYRAAAGTALPQTDLARCWARYGAFAAQQIGFALQSTGIACQAAVLPQHAVAGHHHTQGVAPHGGAHGGPNGRANCRANWSAFRTTNKAAKSTSNGSTINPAKLTTYGATEFTTNISTNISTKSSTYRTTFCPTSPSTNRTTYFPTILSTILSTITKSQLHSHYTADCSTFHATFFSSICSTNCATIPSTNWTANWSANRSANNTTITAAKLSTFQPTVKSTD